MDNLDSDWFNRFCDDDPSWQKSLADLVGKECPITTAMLSHFAYSISEFLDHIISLRHMCESPIETAFLEALIAAAPGHGLPVLYQPHDLCAASKGEFTPGLYIEPQHQIILTKHYRADFLLVTKDRQSGGARKLIIECDGHDFHERTKEQASRDKSRDREMTVAGLAIMRFTGSEIHKDAKACAEQACSYLARLR